VRVRNMATQPILMEELIESDNDEIDLEAMREQIDFLANPDSSEDEFLDQEEEERLEINSNLIEERSE
jgi:hypothetical protein